MNVKMNETVPGRPETQGTSRPSIAVLGGTGPFGRPYIQEFLDQGLTVKVLARSPRGVGKRFPRAHLTRGSMMDLSAVTRLLQGAAAAFLITPVGGNDDTRIEMEAARIAVTAAETTRLPHLIYLSLIQPSRPTGVPMLDVKGQIETMAVSRGVPFSSLRTGCYMDAWLAFFPLWMKLGLYVVPIPSGHRFSFTYQRDVARAAVELMRNNTVLNGAVDVVEPRARTLRDVVDLCKTATGQNLVPIGRWLLPVLQFLRPTLLRWVCPRVASRVSLFSYFNANDWVGDPHQLARSLPKFHITTMEEALKSLQQEARPSRAIHRS